MSEKNMSRMGDGYREYFTADEIREDIRLGMEDAADRGNIPGLSIEEQEYLFEILTMPGVVVGVEYGKEIVTTSDSGAGKIGHLAGIQVDRIESAMIHERGYGADSVDLGHIDYSYKAVKSIMHDEALDMQYCVNQTIMPILYGGMTNLGSYTYPDGPCENWAELLPLGKIVEAEPPRNRRFSMR